MSSEKSVQKKTYLKKGSRQFLSNAQVRSQSSKPKIVDFGADQQQNFNAPILKVRSSQNVDTSNQDIKIKMKPLSSKGIPSNKNTQVSSKKIDRPPIDRNKDIVPPKPKRQTSIGKKKQAGLSDYLDNQSGLNDEYDNKRSIGSKNQVPSSSHKKFQPKRNTESKRTSQLSSLKNANLVQQDDDVEEQQTPNFMQNDSFMPINNPLRNKQNANNNNSSKQINNKNRSVSPKVETKVEVRKKPFMQQKDEQNQDINFISDKSQGQQEVKSISRKNITTFNQRQNRKQQQLQEQEQQEQPISKVKNKFFNRNSNINTNNQRSKNNITQQTKPVANSKKTISINQIPKQIKQQIIKQTIAQKQMQLHQQLQKLKQKFAVVNKQRQKLQQEQKSLIKAKQQFQKQIQQKNKQFEQKMKNQNSKLAREKKYMKDAQMSGQGDRKIKVELEETKKLLQKQKQQRKKIQAKYKAENQNLRKKLAQQSSNNKLLCEKVKLLEHGSAMNKQQLNEMIRQQRKGENMIHRVGMWAQAPNTTHLIRFLQQDFSLIEMDPNLYKYEENQYYQYYLKIKDIHSPLQSESSDQDRAKRIYRSGKIQIEHFQRYIKQTFPFKYSIVFMCNGDVKQVLPEGIMIYYSQNSGAIHYSLKKEGLDKQIVYFPSCQTVQMQVKFKQFHKNYNQVYCNGHLKRTYQDGSVIYQKRDTKGKIITLPANN